MATFYFTTLFIEGYTLYHSLILLLLVLHKTPQAGFGICFH